MRHILLALALLSVPSSLVVAQGRDMGQGHCAKHGNYSGSSCPGCAGGGGGGGGGGSNSGISAAELAEMRRQAAEAAERERVEREKRRAAHEKEEIDAALETARKNAPGALEEEKKSAEAERIQRESAAFSDGILKDLFGDLRDGPNSPRKTGGLDFAGNDDLFAKGAKDSAPVDASGKARPKLAGSENRKDRSVGLCATHGMHVGPSCPDCQAGGLDFMGGPGIGGSQPKAPKISSPLVPGPSVVHPDPSDPQFLFPGETPERLWPGPRNSNPYLRNPLVEWQEVASATPEARSAWFAERKFSESVQYMNVLKKGLFPEPESYDLFPADDEGPEFWRAAFAESNRLREKEERGRLALHGEAFNQMDLFIENLEKRGTLAPGEKWNEREKKDPQFHRWMDDARAMALTERDLRLLDLQNQCREEFKKFVNENRRTPAGNPQR